MFPEEKETETHRPPLNFTGPKQKKTQKGNFGAFFLLETGRFEPLERSPSPSCSQSFVYGSEEEGGGDGGGDDTLPARRPSLYCLQPAPAAPPPPPAGDRLGIGVPRQGRTTASLSLPRRGRSSPPHPPPPPLPSAARGARRCRRRHPRRSRGGGGSAAPRPEPGRG